MIKVNALQDDSGHWYIVPNESKEDFLRDLEYCIENEDDYDAFEDFDMNYGKYRTNGDINNVQLYIKQ